MEKNISDMKWAIFVVVVVVVVMFYQFLCVPHDRSSTEILYTHSLWEVVDHSRSKMHETSLIIIHDPGMRPGPESNRGPWD